MHAERLADQLPLPLLAAFSADSRVYRAFGHFIAPGAGRVLLVPERLAYGRADVLQVVSGCPVPVEDICMLLDTPQAFPVAMRAHHDPVWRYLATLAEDGWQYDYIPMAPRQRPRVLRVVHTNGIRYGEVVA